MAAPLEISTGPKPSGITLLTPIKVSSPAPGDADTAKVVYVGFAADIVHHGHINIIQASVIMISSINLVVHTSNLQSCITHPLVACSLRSLRSSGASLLVC